MPFINQSIRQICCPGQHTRRDSKSFSKREFREFTALRNKVVTDRITRPVAEPRARPSPMNSFRKLNRSIYGGPLTADQRATEELCIPYCGYYAAALLQVLLLVVVRRAARSRVAGCESPNVITPSSPVGGGCSQMLPSCLFSPAAAARSRDQTGVVIVWCRPCHSHPECTVSEGENPLKALAFPLSCACVGAEG